MTKKPDPSRKGKNPNSLKNLKTFKKGDEWTKEQAVKGGKANSTKSMLKKVLSRQLISTVGPEDWEKIKKRLRLPDDATTHDAIIESLVSKAFARPEVARMIFEMIGEFDPQETSQLPQVNINIGFSDPKDKNADSSES